MIRRSTFGAPCLVYCPASACQHGRVLSLLYSAITTVSEGPPPAPRSHATSSPAVATTRTSSAASRRVSIPPPVGRRTASSYPRPASVASGILLQESIDVARRDEVGRRPPVEVVLAQALLGEILEPAGGATRLRHLPGEEANRLRRTGVIALVEL